MSCQVLGEFRAFLGIMFFLTLYSCLLRKRRGFWTWAFGPIEMPGSFAGSSAGDLQMDVPPHDGCFSGLIARSYLGLTTASMAILDPLSELIAIHIWGILLDLSVDLLSLRILMKTRVPPIFRVLVCRSDSANQTGRKQGDRVMATHHPVRRRLNRGKERKVMPISLFFGVRKKSRKRGGSPLVLGPPSGPKSQTDCFCMG